jgi:Leucine-rich repeat (LRR) protein
MTTLDLSNQGLSQVPDLSDYPNLSILLLNDNNLTDVGILPSTLTELYLQNNKIQSLIFVPPSLIKLNILNNRLRTIVIPETMTHLNASFNGIRDINNLPKSVLSLCAKSNMNLEVEFFTNSIDVYISPM